MVNVVLSYFPINLHYSIESNRSDRNRFAVCECVCVCGVVGASGFLSLTHTRTHTQESFVATERMWR